MRTTIAFAGLMIASAITTQAQDFQRLLVGPGAEDVCLAEWKGETIAIVACAERRKGQKLNGIGFHFIGIRHGKPTTIGFQEFRDQNGSVITWSGLHWQSQGIPGARGGVLAASRTRTFRCEGGKTVFSRAQRHIDLFQWRSGTTEPRLQMLTGAAFKTPDLAGRNPFNAVALSSDGTLYATTIGFLGTWGRSPKVANERASTATSNCLYRLRLGSDQQWERVVSRISGANGMAFSPDGKYLAVAAYHSRYLHWFDLNNNHGALNPVNSARIVGWHPDNLRSIPGGILIGTSKTFSTGLNLIFSRFFGGRVFCSAPGAVALIPDHPTNVTIEPFALLPKDYRCPTSCARLGDWYLATQLLDDDLLYWPASN